MTLRLYSAFAASSRSCYINVLNNNNNDNNNNTHFVVVSRHQQTPPLTISSKCHNLPRSGGSVLISPGGRSVDSTRWSQILIGNRDFCLPHLHSTPPLGGFPSEYCHDVWYGKLEWFGYPTVKKIWTYDYSFWQNVRTWQTDGRTPHDGIGRACIASRGQKLISSEIRNMTKFWKHMRNVGTDYCIWKFLPRDAMHKRGLCRRAVSVGLSVRWSVCPFDFHAVCWYTCGLNFVASRGR